MAFYYFNAETKWKEPPPPIYGASWDGSSSTVWTRTDNAAGFADPVPQMSDGNGGWTVGSSPFDTIMPWAGMQIVEDSEAGTLVSIPKFWYKITQSSPSTGMQIQISPVQQNGFNVSPAHMDRGDGEGERDVIYVGRYHCSSSNHKSETGQYPYNDITRSTARTVAHNLGTDIWQWDYATRFTIWLLYLVEFANWNSQDCIGYGCGDGISVGLMGYTDSMTYHTGTTQTSRAISGLGIQYRYIEGLWDNVYDWIDGCYHNSNGLNIILNPNNFSDSSGGTAVGIPTSGYPSQFIRKDITNTFEMFIPSESNGSATTYACDMWNFNSNSLNLWVGGFYNQNVTFGLFYNGYSGELYSNVMLGSRLMKLPSNS